MTMIKYSPPWTTNGNRNFIYCLDFYGNIIHKVGPNRTNYHQPQNKQQNQSEYGENVSKIEEFDLFQIESTGLATLIKHRVGLELIY